jgi:hypothetical protein
MVVASGPPCNQYSSSAKAQGKVKTLRACLVRVCCWSGALASTPGSPNPTPEDAAFLAHIASSVGTWQWQWQKAVFSCCRKIFGSTVTFFCLYLAISVQSLIN